MRGFILFLVCARVGFAQSGPDGAPLLQAVADSFLNLTSYHTEGQISLDIGITDKLTFRISTMGQQLRIDGAGGEDWARGLPVTIVCDGSTGWVSYSKDKKYARIAEGDRERGSCTRGTLAGFEHLADNLRSAVITGTGQAQFEGRQQPCVIVESKYRQIRDVTIAPGVVSTVGRSSRRFCIDEARKLVLTDHIEAALEAGPHPSYLVVDVTYGRIERNPILPPSTFERQPPQGYAEAVRPVQPPGSARRSAAATGRTADGRVCDRPGNAGVYAGSVGRGNPGPSGGRCPNPWSAGQSVRVTQPIGWGLDEKAMESVRKWRFNPASKDGVAEAGEATAIVRFVLPEERPEQPSLGPVSKPVPPGLLPLVELTPPTELENFFYVVGVNLYAPAVCERIGALVMGSGGGFSAQGFQVQHLRSQCYREMSQRVHDPKLCEHVTPVRISGLDGSGFDKENCLKQLYAGQTIVIPFDYAMFARFVQQLGYDDAAIRGPRTSQIPLRPRCLGARMEPIGGSFQIFPAARPTPRTPRSPPHPPPASSPLHPATGIAPRPPPDNSPRPAPSSRSSSPQSPEHRSADPAPASQSSPPSRRGSAASRSVGG